MLSSEIQSSEHSTPLFNPLQPSVSISYPIKTLEELESRAYFKSFDYPFNNSSVPLKKFVPLGNRPRILVCHDFKGGYTDDDKRVRGRKNPNAYEILHSYLIDVFVCFAHYLVTLPPPSSTNVADKHDVKLLGTFIAEEWNNGPAICDELFATKDSAQLFAERLAELATNLGFDGWLINMEVDSAMEQVPNLKKFIRHLTRVVHSSVAGSLVIWYASVTITREISYQNRRNDMNKPFLDIFEGIFTNYTWEEDYPKQSANVAGDRKFDVYSGNDVFGRGTYGGGGWNTNVALDVCEKSDVSAAIFAPGRVYKTEQPSNFEAAQNKWWGLVEKSQGVVKHYPDTLPFYSDFDLGSDCSRVSVEGKQVSSSPWNNISSQGLQPLLELKDDSNSESIALSVDFKKAFNGGVNITFEGALQNNNDFTARLFRGNLHFGEMPLYIEYSFKSAAGSLIGLSFTFSSTSNERTSVLFTPSESTPSKKFDKVILPRTINRPLGWIIEEGIIEMNGFTLTEIRALCFKPESENGKERQHDPSDYSQGNLDFPSPSSWLFEAQNIERSTSGSLSANIVWKLKDGNKFEFSKYNIYVEKISNNATGNSKTGERIREYIGAAYVEAFYVSDLSIPSTTSSLKFTIQACSIDGICQKLDNSPSFSIGC